MKENLTKNQLADLISKVFQPQPNDRSLIILLDVPNEKATDNPNWQDRRMVAFEWETELKNIQTELGLEKVEVWYYENVGSNNADFPAGAFKWSGDPKTVNYGKLKSEGTSINFEKLLAKTDIIFAPTEFSATAPLKVLAKKYGFRAASMPGFSRAMIPALALDYEEVHRQVMKLKTRLDEAISIEIKFRAEDLEFHFCADLRHRSGHASSGLIREPGQAWNLPSGEAFIVPYEGELGVPSKTNGLLPVQFGEEIVVYKIENNKAVEITSTGGASQIERQKLSEESAYGNIAEIGFGVLEAFGIKPIGEMLLDEKLGLHIAFGRSDHFGGATSPENFRNPENVVHIDRIYIPEVQNKIQVKEVVFLYPGEERELIIQDGSYTI